MYEDAFAKRLSSLQKQQPFVPYAIHFKDGGYFLVQHPEAVAYHGRVAVFITPTGASHRFDSDSVTRMNEYIPAPEEQLIDS